MMEKNDKRIDLVPEEEFPAKEELSLVWHYTTAPVLPKFFEENAVMYATHISFLNDRTECSIASDTFRLYLYQQYSLGEIDTLEEVDKVASSWTRTPHAPFVACFSTLCDDLSQWRAYTVGGGYAIGFDLDLMKMELVPAKEVPTALVSFHDFRKCTYISKKREKQMKDELLLRAKTLKERPRRDSSSRLSDLEANREEALTREILRETVEAVFFKNIGFQAESEVRFAILYDSLSGAIPDTTIINGSPRVPIHLRHPIWWSIRKIVVGPTGNAVVRNQILAEYLAKEAKSMGGEAFRPISVVPSEIPFRS